MPLTELGLEAGVPDSITRLRSGGREDRRTGTPDPEMDHFSFVPSQPQPSPGPQLGSSGVEAEAMSILPIIVL